MKDIEFTNNAKDRLIQFCEMNLGVDVAIILTIVADNEPRPQLCSYPAGSRAGFFKIEGYNVSIKPNVYEYLKGKIIDVEKVTTEKGDEMMLLVAKTRS
jgi:hypothetical protein